MQLHFVPLHSHCSFTPQAFWFSLHEKLVPVPAQTSQLPLHALGLAAQLNAVPDPEHTSQFPVHAA